MGVKFNHRSVMGSVASILSVETTFGGEERDGRASPVQPLWEQGGPQEDIVRFGLLE